MEQILFANNVSTTLSQALSSGGTAAIVVSGSLFPAPTAGQVFYATIRDSFGFIEHVKCTARVGNTLTIVRGQDGTPAMAFSPGATVEMNLIAQILREISPATLAGVANGLAQLDAGGFLLESQIPGSLLTNAEATAQFVSAASRNMPLGFAGLDATGRLLATTLPLDSATMSQVAALFVPITAYNAPNGVPQLGVDGKISADLLPADLAALIGGDTTLPTTATFVDLSVTNATSVNVLTGVVANLGSLGVSGDVDVNGTVRVGGGSVRGRLTLSTTAPTGVPGPGDEWVQYV